MTMSYLQLKIIFLHKGQSKGYLRQCHGYFHDLPSGVFVKRGLPLKAIGHDTISSSNILWKTLSPKTAQLFSQNMYSQSY